MFTLTRTYGRFSVSLTLKDAPVHRDGNSHLFGFPLQGDASRESAPSIDDRLNAIGGYFAFVHADDDGMTIANDITGGYRLYVYRDGESFHISDNYRYLLELIGENHGFRMHDQEYAFWRRHRYTTGARTFIKRLEKLPPAGILKIDSGGVHHRSYFRDVAANPSTQKHTDAVINSLKDTLRVTGELGRRIVLCFSGGSDSTLLAMLLKEQGIEFRPVCFRADPAYRENWQDCLRARAVCESLGLSLDTLPVSIISNTDRMRRVADTMLFDRHLALLHFVAMEEIRQKYGENTIIINGQAADSILSFGPSQKTRGDFVARTLMHRPFSLRARLAAMAVSARLKQKVTAPKHRLDYLAAFLDPIDYYPVIRPESSLSYRAHLESVVEPIHHRFTSWEAAVMYAKIFGFVQGSDNQVVIRAAHAAGMRGVVMPFASPEIIYGTIAHRDSGREITHPKYVIREALKSRGFRQPSVEKPANEPTMVPLAELTAKMDAVYDGAIDDLMPDRDIWEAIYRDRSE